MRRIVIFLYLSSKYAAMPVFFRPLILLFLLSPLCLFAQDSVTLDLTKPEYKEPLNHTSGIIGSTLRSYGYHDIVNISGETTQAQLPDNISDKGYSVANTVNIAKEAHFADAIFMRQANFSNTFFNAETDFRGTHFSGPTDFSEATFYESASFMGARFDSASIFSDAFFQLTSNFIDAHFNGKTFFPKADFRYPALFSGTQFQSESDFSGAHFDSIIFAGAEFHAKSSFVNTAFSSYCDFSSVHFHSTTDFSKTRFSASANFCNAQFDKDVAFSEARFKYKSCLMLAKIKVNNATTFDFSHAVLPDSIDFSYNPNISSDVSAIVDFTQADSLYAAEPAANLNGWQKFRNIIHLYFYPSDTAGSFRKHKINLYNTDISRVKIDYDHFRFYAADMDNRGYELPQAIIKSIYEGLLQDYESRGQRESFEKLDVEYRRYRAGLLPGQFSWQDMWWGFGYQKWRIFLHSLVLILFFSLITFFLLPQMNDAGYGVYPIGAVPEFSYSIGHKPFKRLWSSIVYTCNIFFAITLKSDKIRFSKPGLTTIWLIIIYSTGLICMAFMLSWFLQK